ncbi:armadillo-type protein [Polychytrium aggregatum]|uniref:armadillo-type protein n=1 Tax=Polychytrium aggregatum TaxID=110093 RepID=UPI0022FEC7D0|nr:armadillo-type protein [Polychytrium aggregatum]KAI9207803.1 armadillo-type protein [Polychytrium aggregatum]
MSGEQEAAIFTAPHYSARPESRPEHIHNIVETVDRYNPDNIPVLQEYIQEQIANDTYDRDACLATLKLYQFNPTLVDSSSIIRVLLLALGALPDPDFSLCLCLLSEETYTDSNVAKLIELQQYLEQCKFQQFWSFLDSDDGPRDLLTEYPHFERRIREFVSDTVAITYQSIQVDKLKSFLSFEERGEFEAWAEAHGWAVDESDASVINLPVSKDNQPKPAIVQESLKFDQLTKVVGYGRLA